MNNSPESSFDEQVEAIRQGKVSNDRLPDVIAQLQKEIEAQKERERAIELAAEERRKMIQERNIDSGLQRMMNVEP